MTNKSNQYYLLTQSSMPLFVSIQRFFKYVLNLELKKFNYDSEISINDILITSDDERDNPELLDFLVERNISKIIRIGFDNNGTINLLDLNNLKANLESLLTCDAASHIFSEDEVNYKLKNLFHSHGQDSLFEKLSNCQYYISNGIKLYQMGDLDEETFQQNFIKPGIDNWNLFKERINRYHYFLFKKCMKNETERIFQLISSVDHLLEKKLDDINNGQKSLEENNLDEFVALINQIAEILLNVYGELTNTDAKIQTTNN